MRKLFVFPILLVVPSFLTLGQELINLDEALKNKGEMLLSEIAVDIDIVKLETTSDCYFYKPLDIQLINGRIYFYDKKINEFFIYDEDGMFIRKFGKHGKGPNEFVNIKKFTFNSNKDELIVYTQEKKIIKYDLDGELIESIIIKENPFTILPYKNCYLGYYPAPTCLENKGYALSLIGKNGELQKRFFNELCCESRDAILFNGLYPYKNELRFWDCAYYMVYGISQDFEISRLYNFSSKKKMPKQYFSSLESFQYAAKTYLTIQNIVESDDYLFIKGRYQSFGTGMYVVYDKKNKESISLQDDDFNKIGIRDDMLSSLYFWPFENLTNGKLVFSVEVLELKEKLDNIDKGQNFLLKEKHEQFRNIIDSSNINDNPILFIVKIEND